MAELHTPTQRQRLVLERSRYYDKKSRITHLDIDTARDESCQTAHEICDPRSDTPKSAKNVCKETNRKIDESEKCSLLIKEFESSMKSDKNDVEAKKREELDRLKMKEIEQTKYIMDLEFRLQEKEWKLSQTNILLENNRSHSTASETKMRKLESELLHANKALQEAALREKQLRNACQMEILKAKQNMQVEIDHIKRQLLERIDNEEKITNSESRRIKELEHEIVATQAQLFKLQNENELLKCECEANKIKYKETEINLKNSESSRNKLIDSIKHLKDELTMYTQFLEDKNFEMHRLENDILQLTLEIQEKFTTFINDYKQEY
ncbi:hypothetical protein O9G_003426 [Rozella allomycis CSF55]|uniref:Uncharacterized protein n=1 Tax=Rozella allomycis (strain CSF55) TaxID=988480 RepID=A0A075AU83_ROZAC|nr:hypothetical protein O9G_003426 [Rozella allomycis CSF55]|eukprot:EPZ32282.1 hypothetical protein O9G_003426 [Rozella allomycis CSF55]